MMAFKIAILRDKWDLITVIRRDA